MTDTSKGSCGRALPPQSSVEAGMRELKAWFVREVLPLEADLMQFLRRHSHAGCDVNDLRQEVYLRVYESAQSELPQSARAFAFTIARNVLVDEFRRTRIIPIDRVSESDFSDIPSDEPEPDRSVIARDELERLFAALNRLPPRSRQAVVMRTVDQLSRREIAKRMGIAEETAKWHLHNGLRLLIAMLQGQSPGRKRDS
jgi:RNA polymerase sigma factor (sigma-70 family)